MNKACATQGEAIQYSVRGRHARKLLGQRRAAEAPARVQLSSEGLPQADYGGSGDGLGPVHGSATPRKAASADDEMVFRVVDQWLHTSPAGQPCAVWVALRVLAMCSKTDLLACSRELLALVLG